MIKRILIILLALLALTSNVLANYEPIKEIPYIYKKQDLIPKLLTIVNSQVGYKEAEDGTTAYHHDLFKNLDKSKYLYNCEWCTVFIAWSFKKAGIYTPVFANYPATSAKTLAYRFATAGKQRNDVNLALFDSSYLVNAKAGDLIFYNWKKTPQSTGLFPDKFNHISIITSTESNKIKVVDGNFKKSVWKGELSQGNKRHNIDNIVGIGVIDLKPKMPTNNNYKTPFVAYNYSNASGYIVYFVYQDGTCLTNKGEIPLNKLVYRNAEFKKATTNKGTNTYADMDCTVLLEEIKAGIEYTIICKNENKTQIIYKSSINKDKQIFNILKMAWINN